MAKSKYEYLLHLLICRYVKLYEKEDKLLPDTWIVVRIDGKGFHKYD